MGLISGFRVEWGWMSLTIAIATTCLWRCRSCFSFSPSPPEVSILLLKAGRWFRVGCVDCVVGFVSIPGCWIVWIVLLGCVDFGCVDLVAGFVFLVFRRWVMWIVLLGLFRFRVTGLCCWVVLIPGASILLLGLFFLFFCQWVVWIPVWYQCGLSVWVGGCVGKEMNILFE